MLLNGGKMHKDKLPYDDIASIKLRHKSFMGGYNQARYGEQLKVMAGAIPEEWTKGYERGVFLRKKDEKK